MARNVHHATRRTGTHEDADGRYKQDGAELGGLGTHGGAHEVDCIIRHTHRQVEGGQDNKENQYSQIKEIHIKVGL